jgi:hypothetical protein
MIKTEAAIRQLRKELNDKGRFIEAGFVSDMLSTAPDNVSDSQIAMVRFAFFTGARHMLGMITDSENMADGMIDKLVDGLRRELSEYSRELIRLRDEYERREQARRQ